MKQIHTLITALALLSCLSCSRYNGYIAIKNTSASFLKIQTYPRITCGACDKGIMPYRKDSLIWIYGSTIKSIIPRLFNSSDDFLRSYKENVNDTGTYLMFPNSSFSVGHMNTTKKVLLNRGQLNGTFTIKRLVVYTSSGTLIANGNIEIWDLLVALDSNHKKSGNRMKRKRVKNWMVQVE